MSHASGFDMGLPAPYWPMWLVRMPKKKQQEDIGLHAQLSCTYTMLNSFEERHKRQKTTWYMGYFNLVLLCGGGGGGEWRKSRWFRIYQARNWALVDHTSSIIRKGVGVGGGEVLRQGKRKGIPVTQFAGSLCTFYTALGLLVSFFLVLLCFVSWPLATLAQLCLVTMRDIYLH